MKNSAAPFVGLLAKSTIRADTVAEQRAELFWMTNPRRVGQDAAEADDE
jgi:hypothetical protein